MRRKFFFLITAVVLLFALPASPESAGNKIYLIQLSDAVINPVTAEYITRAIDTAEKEKAAALIIELDTPGGLLTSTREIVKRTMASSVPVIVYVAPSGARAGSAGVFITLAANIAAMAPSTNIGAAHPVMIREGERRSFADAIEDIYNKMKEKKEENGKTKRDKNKKDELQKEPMEEKVVSDTVAWIKAIANQRGRNVEWAVKAVKESISIPESEAVENRVVDFVAADTAELLGKMDGRVVKTSTGDVRLSTKGANVVHLPMSMRQSILLALANPNIAYILLMLGFYGLLFEFTNPGIGFPGVAGTIAIITGFYGMHLLNANYAGVALIILAIILFIMEMKVVSYGLLTLGGIISLVVGSLMVFDSPHAFMRISLPLVGAFSLATLFIVFLLVSILIRSHKRKIATGSEGLIGKRGEVKSWDNGRGKIFVNGELWNAEGNSNFKKGDTVEVVKVDGIKLIVK